MWEILEYDYSAGTLSYTCWFDFRVRASEFAIGQGGKAFT